MLVLPLLWLLTPPALPSAHTAVPSQAPSAAATRPAPCREWRECREQALAAAARREYELFHDLAWKTVQTGPARNPEAMLLLARAQALSGRPHDALVMIQRLADMGVGVDVGSDDFARTRELPGWPDVAMRLVKPSPSPTERPAAASVTPAATPVTPTAGAPATASRPSASASVTASAASATPAAPVAVAVAPRAVTPGSVAVTPPAAPASLPVQAAARTDVARFTAPSFAAGGLAYDAVSRRFVIGDALARKLLVVGVNGEHSTDMVRAESAGFQDVAAVEIDVRRGDLWVAGAAGALHRLQLVSGRPLKTYRGAPAVGNVRLADLAVTPSGAVIALDTEGSRLLSLSRGSEALSPVMPVTLRGARSLALDDEDAGYLASADGLARIDLRGHSSAPLVAPAGVDLTGIERIRLHRGAIIALQRLAGAPRILRIDLNRATRRIAKVSVIDPQGPAIDRPFLAIDGDDLYYVTQDDGPDASAPYIVRRLALR